MSGVAVVTGAASGIGAAVVARLERDGWEVVGVDRIEGPGIISADVTSEDQLARAAAGLVGRRVDALVCAAGIWDRDDDRYTSVSDDVWHRTWAVNVTGTMLTLRAFAPLMGEGGSVVTIASMAAVSGIPKRDAYTASKGAVLALSRAWAADLIRLGIRVNTLAPGIVETPMTEHLDGAYASSLPLGRPATAAEVASVVAHLAGPESSYLNGVVIPVDGGLTAVNSLVSVAPRSPMTGGGSHV
ncbi:2-(R)-hydroxypropyl-CoM dehydrogenase [Nocardioides aquaticus]|uniref:2-(R)-hydroxypropyl-CoM dehydrogenase n=3 Tax=Nocardioides aquaticus TaxID=160826 RepID=A0ABX8ECP5_9ACTN|nr:SDR family oxidoreductase [Nocardioides aquaticus]QVT77797.1 2-(R)-hydroxypropyl-CoM dehydrogenase [Nocardioides aquaticus]